VDVELEKAMDDAESACPALRSVSWSRVAVTGTVVGSRQFRPAEVVTVGWGLVMLFWNLGLGRGQEIGDRRKRKEERLTG